MMRALLLWSALLVPVLSGCAVNLPPAMLMPRTVDAVPEAVTRSAFTTEPVTLEERKVERYLSAENFRIALDETLKRANLFGTDAATPYRLRAHVLEASFPGWGFTMASTLHVRYVLETPDGKPVLDHVVQYEGEATVCERLLGASRARLALQRTQQGHFLLLLERLKLALRSEAPPK